MSKIVNVCENLKKYLDKFHEYNANIDNATKASSHPIDDMEDFEYISQYNIDVNFEHETVDRWINDGAGNVTDECRVDEIGVRKKSKTEKFKSSNGGQKMTEIVAPIDSFFDNIITVFNEEISPNFNAIKDTILAATLLLKDLNVKSKVKDNLIEAYNKLSRNNIKSKTDKEKIKVNYKDVIAASKKLSGIELSKKSSVDISYTIDCDSQNSFVDAKLTDISNSMEARKFKLKNLGTKYFADYEFFTVFLTDEPQIKQYGYPYTQYFIPSKSEALALLQTQKGITLSEDALEGKKEIIEETLQNYYEKYNNCKEMVKRIKKMRISFEDAVAELKKEAKNLLDIVDAYETFEKAAINEFKGPKGKKYNKNKIADKYATLVAVYGEKKAKKKIKKILEKTGSKLSASTVISLYTKKYKDGEKLKGNVTFGKPGGKPPNDDDTGGTTETGTGAHVVTAKAKNKITKKKSSTSNVLVGATALAATRTGLKAEIKDIKADATTQISNAQITAGDKKKELEIEKNERIAAVNQKAKEEIDAINPEDENAQQIIDEIKENAQQEVEEINKEYNQNIAQIDEDLNKEVKTIEEHRDTAVKDLNNELNNLKSDKKATTVVEQKVESSAKVTTAAATSKIAQSDVTDSNEKMMNATGELSDTYEEKSAAIQEYVSNSESNNTSSSDTSSETTPVSTPTNTSDTNTNVAEESVASPTSTQSSSENTSSEPTYTSSNYSSEDNYVTNDGMREDVVEPVTEATTETSTDTGVDQSNVKPIPKTDSTTSTTTGKDTDDTISIAGSDDTDSKKGSSGSGLGTVIPVGLGIAATGAAAVAGVRYVKNRKQNEDMDETYDDENNDLDDSSSEYEDIPSDSAYMRDDYLGPEGSTYTEVPDENSYTDAEELEEAAGINDFSEDAALNDLN